MREFRFRVFDRLTNEMIDVTKLEWGPHQINKFKGRTGDSGGWYEVHEGFLNEKGYFNGSKTRIKRYVLMQNTGLKDKNGTEIYEGDITTNKLYKNEGVAFVVYYDKEEYMFKQQPFVFKYNGKVIHNKDLTLQMGSVINKEIIGNVFQNGGLLNDS